MHLTQRIMITADNHTETAFEYPPSSSGLRAVLAEEIRKSNAQATSPLGRVMRYWKGNPKTRVAIGMGLLAGGVIATATGALGAAGIIM